MSRGFRSARSGGARRDLSTRSRRARCGSPPAGGRGRNAANTALRDAVVGGFADMRRAGLSTARTTRERAPPAARHRWCARRRLRGGDARPKTMTSTFRILLRRGARRAPPSPPPRRGGRAALDAAVVAVLCAYSASRLHRRAAARVRRRRFSRASKKSAKTPPTAARTVPASNTSGCRAFSDAGDGVLCGARDRRSACVRPPSSPRLRHPSVKRSAPSSQPPRRQGRARSGSATGSAAGSAGLLGRASQGAELRQALSSGPGPSADPRSVRAHALPFSRTTRSC